jgi:hypothetical protein
MYSTPGKYPDPAIYSGETYMFLGISLWQHVTCTTSLRLHQKIYLVCIYF